MSSTSPPSARRIGKAEQALLKRARAILAELSLNENLPPSLREAAMAATEDDDIVAALRGIGAAIVALGDLEAAAKSLKEAGRRELLSLIQESGVPLILLDHHEVTVVSPDPKLDVSDAKKIPKTANVQGRVIKLWTTPKPPEPKPDLDAIAVAIAAGAQIEGVVRTNGTPYLRITAIRAKAPKTTKAARGKAGSA